MKRIGMLAAVVCGLLGGAFAAHAQTTAWDATFVAVDEVGVNGSQLWITGIREGGSTPSTATLTFSTATGSYDYMASCQRLAMLAMSRPGEYLLRYKRATSYSICSLARAAP